jgi:hypothetical protein
VAKQYIGRASNNSKIENSSIVAVGALNVAAADGSYATQRIGTAR